MILNADTELNMNLDTAATLKPWIAGTPSHLTDNTKSSAHFWAGLFLGVNPEWAHEISSCPLQLPHM